MSGPSSTRSKPGRTISSINASTFAMRPGMVRSCELCGHAGPMRDVYPRLRIVRCPCCSLMCFADDVDPSRLYMDAYFAGGEYADYVADRSILQRNFARRIGQLLRLKPGGKLLEIGSAYGFFLELARRHW